MKARFKIGLCLLTLAIISLTLAPFVGRGDPIAEEIRRDFHQQGFKTDLSDFDFTVSKEMSDRADVFSLKGPANMLQPISFLDEADLLTPVGDHAAVVLWKQDALAYPTGFRGYSYLYEPGSDKDVWPLQRELLADESPQLDSATAAVLSGPFAFNLNSAAGLSMLLPHLSQLKKFTQMFASRTLVALHDQDPNVAWTNLFAATRVVTAWQVEPTEISQDVRFACLRTIYKVTWQALQAGCWADSRLAQLQREWESVDVFKPLPDTVAFTGASYISLVREQDVPGVDQNEKDLLHFYHHREVEIRQAIQTQSWSQMRAMPDVTNAFFLLPPETNLPPRVRAMSNSRRIGMQFTSGGISVAGGAAEAEARRRIMITAIALERFHLQHGAYPKSLDALAPDLLKTPPLDFMNGKPLRYSLNNDGHFLLYSVGLDCKDDGGEMSPVSGDQFPVAGLTRRDPDVVWPFPASVALANAHAVEEGIRLQQALDTARQRGLDAEAEREAAQRAAAKELLNNPKYRKTTWVGGESEEHELTYKGESLVKFLWNQKSSDTNQPSLDALFTLKQVIMGHEPEVISYQLPIAYDRLKELRAADLTLIMDSPPDNDYENQPELEGCERATNGDCLLEWNAAFERPGMHAMQAMLMLPTGVDHELYVRGPALAFSSTNLCQFTPGMSLFDNTGANLCARLVESNATFSIEIKTVSEKHLTTLTGSTSNGIISIEWNLLDDRGNKFTNNSFISYFHITVPGSGRSQTLRQPQNKVGTRGD